MNAVDEIIILVHGTHGAIAVKNTARSSASLPPLAPSSARPQKAIAAPGKAGYGKTAYNKPDPKSALPMDNDDDFEF
jgi:hypothetical protein